MEIPRLRRVRLARAAAAPIVAAALTVAAAGCGDEGVAKVGEQAGDAAERLSEWLRSRRAGGPR